MKNGFKTVRLGHAVGAHQHKKRDGEHAPPLDYYDVRLGAGELDLCWWVWRAAHAMKVTVECPKPG